MDGMTSFKRLEKKAGHRTNSDRDSGYEDLSPTGRSDGSLEDIKRNRLSTSSTEWRTLAMLQEHDRMNEYRVNDTQRGEIFPKRHSTDWRKRDVDAGKIGISHMLRQMDSKTCEQELPNLKPALKSSGLRLDGIEYKIPTRKPRWKRRSKSADGKPVKHISIFNPLYTKILSPREMEKRQKWTEKLRIDALLDEEYYKLPYEDINKEIALGRYSRSEPRLNWRRKQTKKVSFSADVEHMKEKRNEGTSGDGEWNWKEDSGFHEMDVSHLKPIVKTGSPETSFDESNVFSDEESESDESGSDSFDESESNIEEGELQSLYHLVKEQERRLSDEDILSTQLDSEIQTNYINKLVMNLKTPSVATTKTRRPICAEFNSKIAASTDREEDLLKQNEIRNFANSDVQSMQPVNLTINKNIVSTNNDMVISGKSTDQDENFVLRDNKHGAVKVNAVLHMDENIDNKSNSNNHQYNQNKTTNLISERSGLVSQDQEYNFSATIGLKSDNIQDNKPRQDIDKEEMARSPVSQSKEEEPVRVLEINPLPLKTFPGVQWHRDFIDYNAQSPLNIYHEEKRNKPEPVQSLINHANRPSKSTTYQPKTHKPIKVDQIRPKSLQKMPKAIHVGDQMKPPPSPKKSPNATNVDKLAKSTQSNRATNVNYLIKPKIPTNLPEVTIVDTIVKPISPMMSSKITNIDDLVTEISLKKTRETAISNDLVTPTSPATTHKPINVDDIIKLSSLTKSTKTTELHENYRNESPSPNFQKNDDVKQLLKPVSSPPRSLNIVNIYEPSKTPVSQIESPKATMDKVIKVPSSPLNLTKTNDVDEVVKSPPSPPESNKKLNVAELVKVHSSPPNSHLRKIIDVEKVVKSSSSQREPFIKSNVADLVKVHSSPPTLHKIRNENGLAKFPSSLQTSSKVSSINGQVGKVSIPPTSPKSSTDDKTSIIKKVPSPPNIGKISTYDKTRGQEKMDIKSDHKSEEAKQQFIDVIGKDKFNFFYLNNKDIESTENNNNVVRNEEPLVEETMPVKPITKYVNKVGDNAINDNIDPNSNYEPNVNKIIKNKVILEEDFFCETDNSDEHVLTATEGENSDAHVLTGILKTSKADNSDEQVVNDTQKETDDDNSDDHMVTDSSDDAEADSDDVTMSSPESNASYNIEQETHEVSIKDSPEQSKSSVNEHHIYYKDEGNSATTTDKSAVQTIVRRKIEETVTDVINITSVISPDKRQESKAGMKSEEVNHSVSESDTGDNTQSKTTNLNPMTVRGPSALPKTLMTTSDGNRTLEYGHHLPSSPQSPPLALPRKSLLNGESSRREPTASRRTNHMNKANEKKKTRHSSQNKRQKGEKELDNMAKIKEAFIKAGLNPKVFDELENFDNQHSVLPSDFRQNFVNMLLTKELDFTDYNIHLRTRTNSVTPNYTVTRKYLPLSLINEQMTWMRDTPSDKPLYTCHIASSNENIHKAALNLTKPTAGTTSPEECYEYNGRDESPIEQTTSPTPSWTESSSSGCFSAPCSPTPNPTAGKPVPMPTSL